MVIKNVPANRGIGRNAFEKITKKYECNTCASRMQKPADAGF
jgi:hypothetical protein